MENLNTDEGNGPGLPAELRSKEAFDAANRAAEGAAILAEADAIANEFSGLAQLVVDAPEPGVMRKLTLSTGSVARFHRCKGTALVNAQRKSGDDSSMMTFALLSEMITIDGKAVLMEDLVQADLFDLLKLQGVFGELSGAMGKVSPTPSP